MWQPHQPLALWAIDFCRLLSKETNKKPSLNTRERFTYFHPLIIACVCWGGATKVTVAFHKRLGNTSIILMAKPLVTQGAPRCAPIIIPGQRIDRNLDNESLGSRSFGHWVLVTLVLNNDIHTTNTTRIVFKVAFHLATNRGDVVDIY